MFLSVRVYADPPKRVSVDCCIRLFKGLFGAQTSCTCTVLLGGGCKGKVKRDECSTEFEHKLSTCSYDVVRGVSHIR